VELHERHQVTLLQRIHREWNSKVLARETSELGWEPLLDRCHLLLGTPYGGDLALTDIGVKAGDLSEGIYDGLNHGEVNLARRDEDDQVIRIQG
jgi:hypothetical protein